METKKYIGVWMDSMSPYVSRSKGSYNADKKTLTMNTMTTNPETGKKMKGKNVIVYKDANTRLMTMYSEDAEKAGEMNKSMEITYTRKEK